MTREERHPTRLDTIYGKVFNQLAKQPVSRSRERAIHQHKPAFSKRSCHLATSSRRGTHTLRSQTRASTAIGVCTRRYLTGPDRKGNGGVILRLTRTEGVEQLGTCCSLVPGPLENANTSSSGCYSEMVLIKDRKNKRRTAMTTKNVVIVGIVISPTAPVWEDCLANIFGRRVHGAVVAETPRNSYAEDHQVTRAVIAGQSGADVLGATAMSGRQSMSR